MTEQPKTNIPDDIKTGQQSLAKGAKTDAKVLVQEMKQIMDTDETIKAMPEDAMEQKIRFSFALLARKYTSTGTAAVYVRPTVKPRATLSKKGKYYGDFIALTRIINKDQTGKITIEEAKLGVGALFGKSAENMKNLDTTKVYKADMYVTEADASINNTKIEGYDLGGNDITFAEVTDVTMPTNEEFYNSYFKPKEKDLKVSLNELDMNIAQKDNNFDIRIITGMVLDSRDGTSPKMGEYGRYEISDQSILESGIRGENLTLFTHPSEADYEKGSYLTLVTLIEKFGEGDPRVTNYMMIPMPGAKKKVIQPKPVGSGKESVDASMDLSSPKSQEEALKNEFGF